MDFERFVPLAKVAPHKREVTGILTQELPDNDGEVMDYDSSKPYFMAWSQMVHEDSAGKSLGNLRVMHQPKAVGKLTAIRYDDPNKTVYITAKVVDDQEWKKVTEGIYTGFSVGGAYVHKWETGNVLSSGKKAVRFTADPHEASLVDRPSVSTAVIQHIKMVHEDGREEDTTLDELMEKIHKPRAVKSGDTWKVVDDDGHVYGEHLTQEVADQQVKALYAAKERESSKSITPEVQKMSLVDDAVSTAMNDLQIDFTEAGVIKRISRRADVKPSEGKAKYGDVAYADETNKKYPIDSEEHIRAAWNYINKEKDASKYSPAEVHEMKAKIIAAWKRKIDAKGPPSAQKVLSSEELKKGLDAAGQLSYTLGNLANFAICAMQEDRWEKQGKPSNVPKKVYAILKDLVPILQQYVQEEAAELLECVSASQSAEKVSKVSNAEVSSGDALSRFETITKSLSEISDLLKASGGTGGSMKEGTQAAVEQDAEKARKAKENGPDMEDEDEKDMPVKEKEARKARNQKRKDKMEADKASKKDASSNDDMLKAVGALAELVKGKIASDATEMDTLKSVVLMQASEIQKLNDRVVRKGAPVGAKGGDRFADTYKKAIGGKPDAEEGGDFGSMLKGIYADRQAAE
ncbi:MAG: DUF6582 domain-containing protein [Bryobacteraceae bacterium]